MRVDGYCRIIARGQKTILDKMIWNKTRVINTNNVTTKWVHYVKDVFPRWKYLASRTFFFNVDLLKRLCVKTNVATISNKCHRRRLFENIENVRFVVTRVRRRSNGFPATARVTRTMNATCAHRHTTRRSVCRFNAILICRLRRSYPIVTRAYGPRTTETEPIMNNGGYQLLLGHCYPCRGENKNVPQ